jgi:hypothetical protein
LLQEEEALGSANVEPMPLMKRAEHTNKHFVPEAWDVVIYRIHGSYGDALIMLCWRIIFQICPTVSS